MTAIIMDGKLVAAESKRYVVDQVKQLDRHGVKPWLATVLVGDNPASATYLKAKHKACEEVGIKSENHHLPADSSQKKVEELIERLNADRNVHGILVQLPLPQQVDEERIINSTAPEKDVDGLHPTNMGRLASGNEGLVPCTPKGIVRLLQHYNIQIPGSRVVIVNRSNLVGRPLALLMINRDATVTICHSKTRNLAHVTKEADILVSAIGRPDVRIGSEYVKQGSTVIDVAISRVNGKLIGDIDYDQVGKVAGHITPVPGGVGPMTVAMLLENTVQATSTQTENGSLTSPSSIYLESSGRA